MVIALIIVGAIVMVGSIFELVDMPQSMVDVFQL